VTTTERTWHQAGSSAAAAVTPPRPVADRQRVVSAVLTLNAATGLVEAVSFAHLGGVFVAYVSGTVVLAGLHLAAGGFAVLIRYAVAFTGFIVGAVLGGIFIGSAASAVAGTLRALTGEFAVLVLAVLADATLPHAGALVTLGLLGAAMAIQFSATKNLKVADLGFAVATGLIHGLVHDFGRGSSVRLPRKILAIVALLAGASVGGLVSAYSIAGALLIGTGLVAAAAVTVAAGSPGWHTTKAACRSQARRSAR
jgi:uncharacterized membrane protein YoaK (UPF0700 family)